MQEIDRATLSEGEEEEISEEHRLQSNATQILESVQVATGLLQGQEGNAFDVLAQAQKALRDAARYLDQAEQWADEAAEISNRLQGLVQDISMTAGSMEADPARLHWLDERLSTYDRLKRKYGGTVSSVLATLKDAQDQLAGLENRD